MINASSRTPMVHGDGPGGFDGLLWITIVMLAIYVGVFLYERTR